MTIAITCMRCDRQERYPDIGQARRDWNVVAEVVAGSTPTHTLWIGYCSPCNQIEQKLFQDELASGQSASASQHDATRATIKSDINRMAGGKKKRRKGKSWKGSRKKGK